MINKKWLILSYCKRFSKLKYAKYLETFTSGPPLGLSFYKLNLEHKEGVVKSASKTPWGQCPTVYRINVQYNCWGEKNNILCLSWMQRNKRGKYHMRRKLSKMVDTTYHFIIPIFSISLDLLTHLLWCYFHILKNIFACLFSVHNTISLSRHEQVCLLGAMMGEVSLET